MNRAGHMLTLVIVVVSALAIACSGSKPDVQVPAVETQVAYQNVLWESVPQIQELCETHLNKAAVLRDRLAGGAQLPGPEALQLLNHIEVEVEQVLFPSALYANTHPEEGVRDAAEKCQQRASAFLTELALNRDVFDVLSAVEVEGAEATRYRDHWLRDYRRSGVDREQAVRERLAAIQDELVVAGQVFIKNIRDDRRTIEVTEEELAGMPADFIDSRRTEGSKNFTISTDYTDLYPVLQYAKVEDVRRRLYMAFANRAYPANDEVLRQLLTLRHEYATTLGYANWADYNAEDKMIGTGAAAFEFVERVADIARNRSELERAELKTFKQREMAEGQDSEIQYWDRFYYVGQVRQERFDVDSQAVRQYFPYAQVIAGTLEVYQEMFGVSFVPVLDAPVWHESVKAFDLLDGSEVRGRFYLDMHPREGKYKHAAMFPLHSGVKGMQAPTASLICNFPMPTDDDPALMEHTQVTVLFHEFGHLVHHMLAQDHDWHRFSGVATEWDFVEAPSQIMEEWAWNAETLQRFARHHTTGEPIPTELVQKMRDADEFGKGLHVMRQLYFAALSNRLYTVDPAKLEIAQLVSETEKNFSPYPNVEDNHYYASFGHLEGYSSMYYTYMWSLMIAKDIFSRFKNEGMNNPDAARDYREKIIEPGGSKDAAQLVHEFLGRDYNFESFRAWLES